MRLTKRGKRVRALLIVLLAVLIAWGVHELDIHTKITTCYESDIGRVCGTTWK